MDTSRVLELEGLLSEVLPYVELRRGTEGLSHDNYRRYMQQCRERYDPSRRMWLSLFRPDIARTDIKDKLLGFVNQELSDYIRDGRIHSATIAFVGGLGGGAPVEDVVQNLVRRAIVDGVTAAVQAFSDCVKSSPCSFYQFFLLSGMRVDAPIEVFDGITLIPLPESVAELPPHLPTIIDLPGDEHRVSVQHLLGKTVVRVEYEASPIFHRPEEHYTFESGPEQHFRIGIKSSEESQSLNLEVLCQALGVAGRCSVRSAVTWTSMLDYEIFDLSTTWGIGGNGYSATFPFLRLDESDLVNRAQLDAVKTLYQGLMQLPPETLEKLRIPIDRLMKSMEETNPLDQIIDLGISLESLYVPQGEGETSLRFALNAAWHLGKNKAERQAFREEFQEIYRARSDVMHAGQLRGRRARSSFDVSRLVSSAQEMCWQGIKSVIEEGEIPNWDSLILGEDPD